MRRKRRENTFEAKDDDRLQSPTPEQVLVIDRALAGLGAFCDVRIVKDKGRVGFIETLESRDMLKIVNDRWAR